MKNKIKGTMLILILIGFIFTAGFLGDTAPPYRIFRTVSATEDVQLTASTQKNAPNASDDGTIKFKATIIGATQTVFVGTAAVDKISFALSNEDSSGNITIRNLTMVLIRL